MVAFFRISAGLFFIMPCVDDYRVVDMRTISFDVPPQEVNEHNAASDMTCLELSAACDVTRQLLDLAHL